MKYMTATRAVAGGILKILPVYFADKLQLSAAMAGDRFCIFGQVLGP